MQIRMRIGVWVSDVIIGSVRVTAVIISRIIRIPWTNRLSVIRLSHSVFWAISVVSWVLSGIYIFSRMIVGNLDIIPSNRGFIASSFQIGQISGLQCASITAFSISLWNKLCRGFWGVSVIIFYSIWNWLVVLKLVISHRFSWRVNRPILVNSISSSTSVVSPLVIKRRYVWQSPIIRVCSGNKYIWFSRFLVPCPLIKSVAIWRSTWNSS